MFPHFHNSHLTLNFGFEVTCATQNNGRHSQRQTALGMESLVANRVAGYNQHYQETGTIHGNYFVFMIEL